MVDGSALRADRLIADEADRFDATKAGIIVGQEQRPSDVPAWARRWSNTNYVKIIKQLQFHLAEREGFEPPIRLPVCRISSAVHSTTLPPLQTSNFNHLANPREEQNRKLAPDWHRACQLLFRHSFCRLRQCALHDLGGTIIGLHEVGVDVERDGR